MFLDTTFIIDLLARDPDAEAKRDALIGASGPVGLSTLTVFEIGVGLRDGERERFETVLESLSVIPPGVPEVWRAVSIQQALRDDGEQIGVIDVLIAGTAAERGEAVLTRNVDEFARVDGIDVETY